MSATFTYPPSLPPPLPQLHIDIQLLLRSFEVVNGIDFSSHFYFLRHVIDDDHSLDRRSHGPCPRGDVCGEAEAEGREDWSEEEGEEEGAGPHLSRRAEVQPAALSVEEPSVSFLFALKVSDMPHTGGDPTDGNSLHNRLCTVDALMHSAGIFHPVINFYYWEFVSGSLSSHILKMVG